MPSRTAWAAVASAAAFVVTVLVYIRKRQKKQIDNDKRVDTKKLEIITQNSRKNIATALNLMRELSDSINAPVDRISQLQDQLSKLTEDDLNELKLAVDEMSFLLSEWVFYYTMRTRKDVSWNPLTGLMNEILTPSQKQYGERLGLTMRRAYWDMIYEDILGGNYQSIVDRLAELQSRIQTYQPKSQQQPVFDLVYIQGEIMGNRFDLKLFQDIIRLCIDSLARLESPASHEVTVKYFEDLWASLERASDKGTLMSTRVFVDSIAFLFSQLDVLEAELQNFRAVQVGADERRRKERDAFVNMMRKGALLTPSIQKMIVEIKSSLSSEGGNSDIAIVKCLKSKLVDMILIDNYFTGGGIDMPETFIPARNQLVEYNRRKKCITFLSTFCVSIEAQLKTENAGRFFRNTEAVKAWFGQLWTRVIEVASLRAWSDDSAWSELAHELVHDTALAVAVSCQQPLSVDAAKEAEAVASSIVQCCLSDSQIYVLFDKRINQVIEAAFRQNKYEVAPVAIGTKPWFLSHMAGKLGDLVTESIVFLADHLKVYMEVYRNLVKNESVNIN